MIEFMNVASVEELRPKRATVKVVQQCPPLIKNKNSNSPNNLYWISEKTFDERPSGINVMIYPAQLDIAQALDEPILRPIPRMVLRMVFNGRPP